MTPPAITEESKARVLALSEAAKGRQEPDNAGSAPSTFPSADQLFAGIAPRSPEEMRKWSWENEIMPRLKGSGLHRRHMILDCDWSIKSQRKVFELCRSTCKNNGAIVVLTGTRGTGKTTLAAQLIIERAWDETLTPWDRQPPYRKLCDLVSKYKPLYADFGSVQTDELMAARDGFCNTSSLAVIDEIHECDDQKFKDRVLTDIVDRRYANRKDTILISNQTVEDFQKSTSDSVLSRVSEHGIVIPCNWQSWRVKA